MYVYIFVRRTQIPKFKKNFFKKDFRHVSLSFNKRWHLKVCTCYGNDNVSMKPISCRIHGSVLRVYDVCASGCASKSQEYVNHDVN
jgi:hypothetical protein